MRPTTIEIEGFTAFRERTLIDFTDLDLFVLHGPTGSGKSSILDAMTFALYGVVPRMGTQGIEALVSTGTTRGLITLTFECAGNTYRVVRKLYTTSTPKAATLHELVDGQEKGLADGIRETNDTIEAIVGIDYEAFSRAVFLPQGKFAEFLHSAASERRNVLQELFQLDFLDRMRSLANKRASTAGARAKTKTERLEGDYEDVSEQALQTKEKQLAELTERAEQLRIKRNEAQKAFNAYDALAKKARDLQQAEKEQVELLKRSNSMAMLSRRLERAEASESVLAALDEFDAQQKSVESLTKNADAAREDLKKTEAELATAKTAAQAAEEAASKVSELREDIQRLEELVERVEALDKARQTLAARKQRLDEVTEKLQETEEHRTEAATRLEEAREKQRELKTKVEELGLDAEWFELLDANRDHVLEFRQVAGNLDEAQAEIGNLEKELEDKQRKLEDAENDHEAAKDRLEAAKAGRDAADSALDELRLENRAAAIRAHLHEGDECPVCAQSIESVPSVPSELDERLENGQRVAEEASARVESAAKGASEARSTAEAAQHSVETHKQQLTEKRKRRDKLAEAVERVQQKLSALLQRVPESSDTEPWAWLLAEHETLEERKTAEEELRNALTSTGFDIEKHELSREQSNERLKELGTEQERICKELEAAQKSFGEAKAKVGDDVPDDPAAEAKARREQIDGLLQRQKDTADRVSSAKMSVATAEATLRERSETLENAEGALKRRRDDMERRLREAEFEDAATARAAVLQSREREEFRTTIDRWEEARSTTAATIERLGEELGDFRLDADELERRKEAADQIETASTQADESVGDLRREVESIRKKLEKAAELQAQLEAARKERDLYNELATALRSDRFIEFVLEERMHTLVAGASARLEKLSGRYRMKYRDHTFWVVDLDNASEEREAKTLSGGETFLASLALALELSEQIQLSAGTLQLDSLFIDEGFGTLDPETLDTVAEAIEQLQETGRLVGVITHVAELRDRLPHRFEVVKGVGTSTVERSETA